MRATCRALLTMSLMSVPSPHRVHSATAGRAAAMRRLLVLPLGVAVAMSTVTAGTAGARPAPDAHEVAKSRHLVHERAAEVGRVRARLAQADARLQNLAAQAETVIERYNGEVVQLNRAGRRYGWARSRLAAARRNEAAAQTQVSRYAAEMYRTEGAVDLLATFIGGSGGPQAFLDRAGYTYVFARRRAAVLERMRAAEIVADVLHRQAADAYRAQQQATRDAARARAAAQAAVAAQRAAVRRIEAQKRRLVSRLGKARAHARRVAVAHAAALVGARARRALTHLAHRSSGASLILGDIAADWALGQLGKPYMWASAGPDSYDCSGLTMRAWQHAGVSLDHWTGSQWISGPHVPLSELHRGDLLFFGSVPDDPATIHHVGIYIGRGRMVEAPYTGSVVRISSIWRPDLVGAVRPGA